MSFDVSYASQEECIAAAVWTASSVATAKASFLSARVAACCLHRSLVATVKPVSKSIPGLITRGWRVLQRQWQVCLLLHLYYV